MLDQLNQYKDFDKTRKRLFLLAVALFLFSLAMKVGFITSANHNIRGVEPSVLFSIQEIMVGGALYPDPEIAPFPVTQYMPLYYILVANISKLFGIVPGEQYLSVHLVGRTLSVIFSLSISILVYIASRKFGADLFSGTLGAILTFILPIPWFSLLRPDALTALFGLSSLILYSLHIIEEKPGKQNLRLIAIGFLGYLSFLSKQNGAIFIVVICLFPILRFKIKELVYISVGVILALATSSLFLSPYFSIIPTESNHFYAHVIGGLDNGIDLHLAYIKLYSQWFSWYFPLFALPLGGIIVLGKAIAAQGFKQTDQGAVFLAFGFILVTIANLIAGVKDGSAIHYMNEPMIIAVLFLIRLFASGKTATIIDPGSDLKTLFFGSFFLFITVLLAHQIYIYRGTFRRSLIINQGIYSKHTEIQDYFDDELSAHPDSLMYADHSLIRNLYFERILFPQEDLSLIGYRRGNLTYSQLTELIEDGTLRYLVLGKSRDFPKKLFGNKLEEFEYYESIRDYHIYINTRSP